jgi:IK cytokine
MSLLEQNRVRAGASIEDDEILEQAFAEVTSISEPTEPRKRTREDIIRDLKANRQNGDRSPDKPVMETSVEEGSAFQAAKRAGKFRPIGFKPIGQTEEKSKKRKAKEGKEGAKKRKKKVETALAQSGTNDKPTEETPAVSQERDTTEPSSSNTPKKPPEPEAAPLDEDFDIFDGTGDYEGFPGDEESEEEHYDTGETTAASATQEAVFPVPAVRAKGWFDEPEPEVGHASIPPEKSPPVPETIATEEEPQEMRLEPLNSSALPSIRDFLAMDEAAEKAEKRKARKEKKKKKKKEAGDDDDD